MNGFVAQADEFIDNRLFGHWQCAFSGAQPPVPFTGKSIAQTDGVGEESLCLWQKGRRNGGGVAAEGVKFLFGGYYNCVGGERVRGSRCIWP